MAIKTKIGQASHMGKWETTVQMERLVRELQGKLEDAGLLEAGDSDAINNVVYSFLSSFPQKVKDELREG